MSSGRLSGLATASKAISGAVWVDAGNAPRQVAASKANKKRFMLNLLPMFLCVGCGIGRNLPMSSPSPDLIRGLTGRSSGRCAAVTIASASGYWIPRLKRGMTSHDVADALSRLCLLHGVRLQDELLHAPGFDLANDDLVRVAAIHHVDHLEAAEFLAGMTELADDRAVELHLVDLARDRPRARKIAIWVGVGGEQVLVRPLRNARSPADADLVEDGLRLEVVIEYLVADVR